jgi:7,8-dihydropterin-6-yl-methyl-4-(beta-D-ribofuranosyl)aminobenzene 5'-phosphate synthase
LKLKVLVDNRALPGFREEWGFSCIVEAGENVLFDVGTSPRVLGFNAEKLGVGPESFGKLVLSHDHWDHTGGLVWALQNPKLKVFAVDSFSGKMKELIRRNAELVEVGSNAFEVAPGVHSTGKLCNSVDEQGLLVETEKGIVVLVGCSHPGLEKILEKAKGFGKVHAVVGGFHGFDKFDALKGIEVIAATHCTEHKEKIRRLFPKQFVECAAGKVFEF